MPIVPWYYKLLGAAVLAAGLCAFCWYRGYSGEHDLRVRDAAQAAQAAKDQAALVIKLNQTIEDNANEYAKDAQNATISIADYYKQHPVVRVRYTDSGCSLVPQTAGNSQGADGAAALGYVSPYSPAETEQVANRLYMLQKLLIKDGVTIK